MPDPSKTARVTFGKPPVTEVSFGLFFTPLANFRTSHFGAFWSRLKPDFDETADKPVVGDMLAKGALQGAEWFPLPRVWFIHREKQQLLQLQPDRFYFNWRRTTPETPYPRFAYLEPLFATYAEKLSSFALEESLGPLDLTGGELVYVNQIPAGEGWNDFAQVGNVFPDLKWERRSALQGSLKGVAWHAKFEKGDITLHADLKSAHLKEDPSQGLFQFELRALSRKKPGSIADARAWLLSANEAIVSAFIDLTSREFQRTIWQRNDDAT